MKTIEMNQCLSDFSVKLDLRGIITEAGPSAFLEGDRKLEGEPFTSLIHPEDAGKFERALESALFLERKQSFVCRLLRKGTLPIWVDCHMVRLPEISQPAFALIAFDVSHWREDESKISYLATHDPLTDLPNRLLFNDRITVAIATVQRHHQPGFALQLLDLDGFKKVNDSLGHVGGDELIKAVAGRLKTLVRESDTVARIGGDEFAFILAGISREREAEIVAKKILTAMHRPFSIEGKNVYLSASIGTAIHPEDGKEPVSLFKHAEMAMYSAKEQGGNCWRLYDSRANAANGDVSMESAMHEGIRNGEFLLHYQPIFCAATGRLKGAEALMRWENPERGTTSPALFIPLAESSGLIELLGRWVLRMACHQARQWQESMFKDFYVSVNVSPRQFRQDGLLDSIKGALEESGLPPASLMLEITEGILMHEPERSGAILNELRACGVRIAIDDFGTGYSSLAYLKKFPLSVLKIDKSFVDELPHCEEDVAIISAVLSLARGLGLSVVAEGVESEEQLDFLATRGCDLIQGYLKGRPVSSTAFQEKFLTSIHDE